MAELDDEQDLIRKSREGDHAAFEVIIKQHQRMIHALTYRMTGSLVDSEDLAQEIFIQAFNDLSTFQGNAKLSSWLYRITVNRCLNWLKGQKRRQRLIERWSQEPDSGASSPDIQSQRVQHALLQLKAKERAAIVLTFYEGLSHAEAARALGCAETTISWRLFSARSKLKKILQAAARSD